MIGATEMDDVTSFRVLFVEMELSASAKIGTQQMSVSETNHEYSWILLLYNGDVWFCEGGKNLN